MQYIMMSIKNGWHSQSFLKMLFTHRQRHGWLDYVLGRHKKWCRY